MQVREDEAQEWLSQLKEPHFWEDLWRAAQAAVRGNRSPALDERTFWDSVAASYGKHTKEKGEGRVSAVTTYLRTRGVLGSHVRVLDIGAGPGTYALPFAPLVREVVALDISPRMCAILRERAQVAGIANVTVVEGAWEEIDLVTQQWEKSFDLVFAALCPAIRGAASLQKMIAAARGYCCIVDHTHGYRNPVLAAIWSAVIGGTYPGGWFDLFYPWNYLYAAGYLPEVRFFPDEWEVEMPLKEAISRYSRSLARFVSLTPALSQRLAEYISAQSSGGIFRYRHQGHLAVLLWRV